MAYDKGVMYKLTATNDTFSVELLHEFGSAPLVYTIYKDQILIAAFRSFIFIKDGKQAIVFDDIFWSGLYPNSICALDEHNIFIGMRRGIAKIDLEDKGLKFYRKVKS